MDLIPYFSCPICHSPAKFLNPRQTTAHCPNLTDDFSHYHFSLNSDSLLTVHTSIPNFFLEIIPTQSLIKITYKVEGQGYQKVSHTIPISSSKDIETFLSNFLFL